MLAHVAINPAQGMLLLAKDSGILAKYGFQRGCGFDPGHAAHGSSVDRR